MGPFIPFIANLHRVVPTLLPTRPQGFPGRYPTLLDSFSLFSMLPLTILSCAVVLLLPVSAAPSPEQRLATDDFASSSAIPGGAHHIARGVGFREADYAVSAATAVQTVIPAQNTKATPAALAAAAPTRAVLPRQVDDPCALADCSELLTSFASASGADPSTLSETQPDPLLRPASLSASNNALAAQLSPPSHMAKDAPGPEARPYAINAKASPVLSQNQGQSQLSNDAPADTSAPSLPIGGSATLAQINAPLLMVSGTGDPSLPKAPSSGSNSNSASTSPAPGIAAVAARSRHERRERRGLFRLARYLSGSSLYPDSDPDPKPINPREVEFSTPQLEVQKVVTSSERVSYEMSGPTAGVSENPTLPTQSA